MSIKYTLAGKTDIGLVRTGNEDNYFTLEEKDLFVVCDGMGGHQAGEVASGMACDIISYCFTGLAEQISKDSPLKLPAQFPPKGDILVKSIRLASRAVFTKAATNPDQSGMGTTVVAAVLEGNMVGIAHAGDSRAYRLNGEKLVRMTTDHSWVTELKKSGMYEEMEAAGQVNKNVITRALGVHEKIEVDYRLSPVKAGEIYILCSDGLCSMVEDDVIFEESRKCNGNVNKIVTTLIKLANDRGGQDNVTVVAFKIEEVDGEPEFEEIKPLTISEESDDVIERQDELVAELPVPVESENNNPAPSSGKSGNLMFFLIILAILIIIILIILSVMD